MCAGGTLCLAPTKPRSSRELSPDSWPCRCNNDSDSCHYQEEEKLKLGCESAFGRKPNKTEEQQTGRRLMWTMGNPGGGQHWRKTVGVHRAGSKCLTSSLGSMLKLHHTRTTNSVKSFYDVVSILKKPSSSAKASVVPGQTVCVARLNTGTMSDFRALNKRST